jgi:DNA-binding NarL/FixJ family response regulator
MDTKHHHNEGGGFHELPAGLVNKNVELFDNNGSLMGTHNGQTFKFNDLPILIRMHFVNEYEIAKKADPDCLKLIRDVFKCKSYSQEIEQYSKCNFGGFDNSADYHLNLSPEKEYWNCGNRGKCRAENIVCKPNCVHDYNLSMREVEIIQLISHGLQDKEIADKLDLAVTTVPTHVRNIREKLKVNNRGEIIRFAFSNKIAL